MLASTVVVAVNAQLLRRDPSVAAGRANARSAANDRTVYG